MCGTTRTETFGSDRPVPIRGECGGFESSLKEKKQDESKSRSKDGLGQPIQTIDEALKVLGDMILTCRTKT